jgi:glycosyltransferase involved in cell wall biosynthesis
MRAVKANLLVIGSGVIETELRQLVEGEQLSDRVVLAGALPSDEALDVVAACDAGLSLIEPISESYALALPSKIFEYMMAGLPVLSSRLVHVEELFAKEPWIHFTDVTSSSAIEAGLRELLDIIGQPQLAEREKELARTQYNFGADAQHAFRDILRAWQVTG